MTITLKDAFLKAQMDLWDLMIHTDLWDIGMTRMARPLRPLAGVLSSLANGEEVPILLVKDTCEALTSSAHKADNAGHIELAERLRCVVRVLSPVVARLSQEA